MSLTEERELTQNPRLLYRISTDGYHRLIELGEIEEGAPFELLDGYIVRKIRSGRGEDPMTVNPDHATAVGRLAALDRRLGQYGCHIRTQQPIALPPFDEPEPDGAIVRGRIEDYRHRHPGAADVLCVFEAADASLSRDRGYKQQLYARAGIALYVIINLVERSVEIYSDPRKEKGRYGHMKKLSSRQNISLRVAGEKTLRITARQLLP